MGIDLTVGDKVYVHTKGTVMTVEDIILPGISSGLRLTGAMWIMEGGCGS